MHCGEEVTPIGAATDSEGALSRFMVIALATIALLGVLAVALVGVLNDWLDGGKGKPAPIDGAAQVEKLCVPDDATAQIGALQAKGLREVGGETGERCFQE